MLLSARLLPDRQGAAMQRLGLRVATQGVKDTGQIAEAVCGRQGVLEAKRIGCLKSQRRNR